jgi:hypothetical protein
MLSATSILLAFWLAVVLLCDIDGFQARRRQFRREQAGRNAGEPPSRP